MCLWPEFTLRLRRSVTIPLASSVHFRPLLYRMIESEFRLNLAGLLAYSNLNS